MQQTTSMTSLRHKRLGVVLVRGRSMDPTFSGMGRLALVRWGSQPLVGDVVVARRPDRPEMRVIKRITDHDARGWWLESDANQDRTVFADSWQFGHVSDEQILGVVVWPRVRR